MANVYDLARIAFLVCVWCDRLRCRIETRLMSLNPGVVPTAERSIRKVPWDFCFWKRCASGCKRMDDSTMVRMIPHRTFATLN